MDFLKKMDIRLLVMALVFWLCSMLMLLLAKNNNLLERNVNEIKQELLKSQTKLNLFLNNNDLINNKLVDGSYTFEEFEKLRNQDYILLIFEGDELIFWNDNSVSLDKETVKKWKDNSFHKLNNGFYYYVATFPDNINTNYRNVSIAALYLVKYDYYNPSNNKYLKNIGNHKLTIPDNLSFSSERPYGQVEAINMNGQDGEPVYAYYDTKYASSKNYWIIFLLQTVAVLLLLATVLKFCISQFSHNRVMGLGILTVFCFVLFFMILGLDFPVIFSQIPVLNKPIHPDLTWISIGKLLMLVFLILVLIAFAFRYVRTEGFKGVEEPKSLIYYAIASFVFSVCMAVACIIAGSIVRSEDTGFLLADLLSGNLFTLMGFGGLLMIVTILFFASKWFLNFIKHTQFEPFKRAIAVFAGLAPMALLLLSNAKGIELYFAMLFSLAVCLILPLLKFPLIKEWRLQHILSILVFSSLILTIFITLIENREEHLNRIEYAQSLQKEDYTTPPSTPQIDSTIEAIASDKTYDNYFKSPLISAKSLENRILKKYFTPETLETLNPSIQIFNSIKKPLLPKSLINSYDDIVALIDKSKPTDINNLYQINNLDGQQKYLFLLDIPFDSYTGSLAIQFMPIATPQPAKIASVDLNHEFKNQNPDIKYDFALYNDNTLTDSEGGFSYSKQKNIFYNKVIQDSIAFRNFDDYSHLFFSPNPNTTIVVSKPENTFIRVISIFSTFFLVLICTIVLAILFLSVVQNSNNRSYARELFYSSFRKRISTTLFVIILFSFFLVGIATSIYFSNRFNSDYEQKLENKRTELLKTIDNEFKEQTAQTLQAQKNSPTLQEYLGDLSKIHSININIYNLKGQLLISSINSIYEDGFTAPLMNPVAFQTFQKKEKPFFLNPETIGDLHYKAAYGTIVNAQKKPIGFLQLPNYESNKEVSSNISNFISTILNAYVIILLLSSFLALYLTRSLTNPLKIIGQKINQIRLGQKNEELVWHDDDEIGELVSKYNEAVHKLESSAKTLAESERQMAYEQMAKQISHEIKNPLTPMKLSIQQLQRINDNNDPRLKDHLKRMCNTLIEQIDHLERVASEFSFFARSKDEKREVLDLFAILNSVIFLYKETRAVKIVKIFPDANCSVLADRTQLTKVFHNILKNAMQAVRHKEQGVIFVNIKINNSNSVTISFTDNGVGIAPEGLEQVFQPNFTTKNAGMGLGLAICRNIIEDIDGEIWLESKLDEGTTFFIKLPLQR